MGALVVATPGVALGYAFVVTSRKLSPWARIPLLLALAAATSQVWMDALGEAAPWRSSVGTLSFIATLTSGSAFLVREARRRRARRQPAVMWPGYPPAGPTGWPSGRP
ncbi:hypothetical protein [Streptomyces sp. NPDC048349]|uniref:hypothetical protein n=1 Tax=Streptomyces sp. NPDC048349 TaxID=3155486 RepID=UPI0034120A20